jgi:cytochrome c5
MSDVRTMPPRRPPQRRRLWARYLLLVLLAVPAWLYAQSCTAPLPGDYRVEHGRVDRGTYTGWRLFHTTCHGCHGIDALGTDVAPNLVERVKAMTPRGFATKVLTSYRLMPPTGESNAEDRDAALERLIEQVLRQERLAAGKIPMPAWDDNPSVEPHVLDLYAYLTARADGALGPGKPQLMRRHQPAQQKRQGGVSPKR